MSERARAVLLGGALGDALGYPVEFVKSGLGIGLIYGEGPPLDLAYANVAPAFISDDTQMTLFCAEGLIAAREAGASGPEAVLPHIAGALLNWFHTQTTRTAGPAASPLGLVREYGLHAQRAPGRTCMTALGQLAKTFPAGLGTRAAPPNDSKGCGAVMRSAPFAFFARSDEEAFQLACEAGALTHGHPSGYLPAGVLSAMVRALVHGASLEQALDRAMALLACEPESLETHEALRRSVELAARGPVTTDVIEGIGQGFTGHEALAIALACLLSLPVGDEADVRAALWTAARHGGDSDSTASILGNLLGAAYGEAILPARWLAQLQLRELIVRVANALESFR